jgi:DNA primase
MQVNESTVYCHACHKLWNPIDILMQVRGYSFVEAVTYLSGRVETPYARQRVQTQKHADKGKENTEPAEVRERPAVPAMVQYTRDAHQI